MSVSLSTAIPNSRNHDQFCAGLSIFKLLGVVLSLKICSYHVVKTIDSITLMT